MKYILIILLSFAFVQPAFAAKTIPGTVPKMLPLQPPPQNAQPNFSGSIQYNGAPAPAQSGVVAAPSPAAIPVVQAAAKAAKISWLWWLLGLFLAVAAAFVAVKKSKRP